MRKLNGFATGSLVMIDMFRMTFNRGGRLSVTGDTKFVCKSTTGYHSIKEAWDVKVADRLSDAVPPAGTTQWPDDRTFRTVLTVEPETQKIEDLWRSPGVDSFSFENTNLVEVHRKFDVPFLVRGYKSIYPKPVFTTLSVIGMRRHETEVAELEFGSTDHKPLCISTGQAVLGVNVVVEGRTHSSIWLKPIMVNVGETIYAYGSFRHVKDVKRVRGRHTVYALELVPDADQSVWATKGVTNRGVVVNNVLASDDAIP